MQYLAICHQSTCAHATPLPTLYMVELGYNLYPIRRLSGVLERFVPAPPTAIAAYAAEGPSRSRTRLVGSVPLSGGNHRSCAAYPRENRFKKALLLKLTGSHEPNLLRLH